MSSNQPVIILGEGEEFPELPTTPIRGQIMQKRQQKRVVRYYEHFGDTLIVTEELHGESLELESQKSLDFWQKDSCNVLIHSTSDPWYRAALRLRKDNPISSRIKIPISFGANQEISLWESAMDEAIKHPKKSPDHKVVSQKIDEYFGFEPNSWYPRSLVSIDFKVGIRVEPCKDLDFFRFVPQACRFVVSYGLLVEIWSVFADRQFDPIDMLWCPGKYARYPIVASNAARLRHDVVWPLFTTTEAFWTQLEYELQRSKPFAFLWPDSYPRMNVPEIYYLLLLYYPKSDPIFNLCNALEAIVGYTSHYSHYLNQELREGCFLPYDEENS